MLSSFGQQIFLSYSVCLLWGTLVFFLVEAFLNRFAKSQSQILAAYTELHGENDLVRD